MKKTFCLIFTLIVFNSFLTAQKLYFPRIAPNDSVSLEKVLPDLAQRILTIYKSKNNRKNYLHNRFILQILTSHYNDALTSIDSLRSLYKLDKTMYPDLQYLQYEIFCRARLMENSSAVTFNEGFRRCFNLGFGSLDDKQALKMYTAFLTRNGINELYQNVQDLLSSFPGDSISMDEALSLCADYNVYQVFKVIEPLARPLLNQDTNNRYIIEDSVMIKTRDGALISALVARKREITIPQCSILQFTIYARKYPNGLGLLLDPAANGYISVVGYTRGKAYSPNEIIPYEFDGRDAYDVIDWISKQPWSNGKVGMFGGSYNGFTQWASTKKLHPALKTIVPSASAAPGLDVPMTNNVFMSFVFPWIYYVTNNKYLDISNYIKTEMWDSVNTKWYNLGRPYNSLDTILGNPSKIYQRWLEHPSYDKYWQDMIPYKKEFAKISIPVLTTTGYYDGGQIGAMYYYREHLKYNKNATHYLLIGPFGHYGSQSYPDLVYNGYTIDTIANIPIHDIIYEWFDYILKGGVKPAVLKDKINWEVMGANEWKHAPSLNKMSNDVLKLYFNTNNSKTNFILSSQKSLKRGFIEENIDFADRSTINNYNHENHILYDTLDTGGGITFVSEPLKEATCISGAFSGKLQLSLNKKDLDFSLVFYELMPDGRYFYLSYFMGRASYARDITKRYLLNPERRQIVTFTNSYITSKKLSVGSRIIIVLNINKSPNEQINYGTGKDVSLESIKDAKTPLKVKWYNSSYIKIPTIK
jgi:putative CocE/NonD family hydrolase